MKRNAEVNRFIKELRQVATEARKGGDLKRISVFTSTAAKSLAFMKFERALTLKARTVKRRK